jgi:hypothetical protein
MCVINVAAAQMGSVQKANSREAVVKRMVVLMDQAKAKGAADLCRRLDAHNERYGTVAVGAKRTFAELRHPSAIDGLM